MLKLFNRLDVFFEDNYKRIHVREYARHYNITPPTASKLLEGFFSQGILKKEIDKQYKYYYANKESELFKDLQIAYWKIKLTPVTDYIENAMVNPIIILFGSIVKGELHEQSDIDIGIISSSRKKLDFSNQEAALGRELQVFKFKNLKEPSKELKNSILNGRIMRGMW